MKFLIWILLDGNCEDQEKSTRIQDYGGVGMLMKGSNGSLGYHYYWGGKPNSKHPLAAKSFTWPNEVESFVKQNKVVAMMTVSSS